MNPRRDRPHDAARLRARAERTARERAAQAPGGLPDLSPETARRTLHELRVHQIELEMQNEELRRAQVELDATRARYFDLYDLAPAGYCTISEQGLILEANLSAAGSLGVDRGVLVRQPITRFILKEDEDVYYLLRKRLFETGHPQEGELRMVRRDGTPFWAHLSATVAANADGAQVCRLVIAEIPEREQAAEALARSRAETEAVYHHAPVMMCLVDARLRVLRANPAFTAFMGVSEDELRGGRAGAVLPCIEALDNPPGCGFGTACPACPLRLAVADTLKTGAAHSNVEHNTTLMRGGERWPVSLLGSTALIHAADSTHALLCLHDITERRRAEERIRAGKEEFDRFFGLVADLAGVVSADGLLRKVNPAWETTLGFSVGEMLNQPFLSFVHPDDVAATRQAFLDQQAGQSAVGFVNRYRTKAGGYRWLEWVSTRLLGDGSVYATGRDVTERRRAEEVREKLQAQLVQARKLESIGRLAGGVAHDFNNLLTVINGYSQLLLDRLTASDPLRDALVEIQRAGERAAALTGQLLAFSRKQVLEPRVLDLNRLVAEVRPMLERLVGESVEVRIALNAQSGAVRADPHQLEQVIMNLAVNARDAMPRGGRLLIETAGVELDQSFAQSQMDAQPGRYVMLAVSDSGVGMDEETKQRIFEPFFTTKAAGQGTGLGLSTVQGIVAQSGGYIDVHSKRGQGSVFKIYLPALTAAAAERERPAAEPALGGTETVLVVEDQAEVRGYVVAVLRGYGYRVLEAANAGEALRLSEREQSRIHLVLTDVAMPHVGGRELAAQLERVRPGIKVLFMSGYGGEAIERQGILAEGLNFIQKPFSSEALAAKIRAVLGPQAPPPASPAAGDRAGTIAATDDAH